MPGEHMFAVGRFPFPRPPSSWNSIETGKSWSLRIVFGSWQWNMTPLFRIAHPGPPLHCSPTKRYSIREPVVRELLLVEDVAELVVEVLVLVVAHLQDAILDAKRVEVVVARVRSP